MEILTKDVLFYMCHTQLTLKEIGRFSQCSKYIYNTLSKYKSLKRMRKWTYRYNLSINGILIESSIRKDWRLIKYSIRTGANQLSLARDLASDKKVKQYLYDLESPIYVNKINIKRYHYQPALKSKILIIGRPGSGKDVLLRDLLYKRKDIYKRSLVIAMGNIDGNIIPPIFTYDDVNQDALRKILKRQRKIIIKKGINDETRTGLIFNNCIFDRKFLNSKEFLDIIKNGRCSNLDTYLAIPYPISISPGLRSCFDYVFILRDHNINNRRKIWEEYASIIPTFAIFCDIMDGLTKNYNCMVICNCLHSAKIEDNVFWYKAERYEDFRLASKKLWEYNEKFIK